MRTRTFKEQLGYPLLAFLLCLFGTSVEGAQLPPPPATQAEVNAGTGTYKYVTPATLAGWSGTPTNRYATNVLFDASGFNGNLTITDTNAQQIAQKLDDLVLGGGGVTGMNTNTFTRFVDGQWQLFTNIPDGSLCFSNLTYPQFVLMLRTNGSLLLTNSTTGASNVMSAAGWTVMSGNITNAGTMTVGSGTAIINIAGENPGGTPAIHLRAGSISGSDAMLNTVGAQSFGTVGFQVRNSAGTTLYYWIGQSKLALASGMPIIASSSATDASTGNNAGIYNSSTNWILSNNVYVVGFVMSTNGVIVSSNSWVNQPALAEGQTVYLSSNGVPYVVWKVGGVTNIQNLTATGAADGVGISTNGGSGINNVFTNATLQDANAIDTWRPSREVVTSGNSVAADFENRNLNGVSANNLNWNDTRVRMFADAQIDGKLTTPQAIVTNTPAADEVVQFTSPTTAKSTASLTLTSLNVGTAGGNGRSLTNLNGGSLFYNTNAVADITLIDLSKRYAHTNHTANFTISGFTTGTVDPGGTNYQFATRCFTNNSVGAKTITLPASWIDVGVKGNPVYNTNIGVLSVWVIPNFATNYAWAGR